VTRRERVVHSDPDILGGTPVFFGTRVPVRSLFDYLEGGDTLDEFLRQFPRCDANKLWLHSTWRANRCWLMRVLLDEQLPIDLASQLHGHAGQTVVGRGWAGIKNGELLNRMSGHYDVLITMDRGIEFDIAFGVVVVRAQSNRMQHLSPLVPAILNAIGVTKPGRVRRVGM
jgi:uncharacterized protein (DUF433 family)